MKAKLVPWRKAAAAPIVLIFGPQDYLASRIVKDIREQLKAKLGTLDVQRISAAEYSGGQLASIAAPSLFAEPKLIIIDGIEKCSDDLIADGLAYLAAPEPDATVILIHDGSSVRGKKLLDSIRESSHAIQVDAPKFTDKDREAFVAQEFADAGRQAQPAAVRALSAAFGDSLAEVASACEQLLQDSAEVITESLVDQYYGGRIEVSAYKIMDAALAGRKVQALEYLRHALGSGSDKVMLVATFASSIRQMAKMLGNNNSATLVGMKPWQIDNARRNLVGWNEDSLARVVTALADADASTKGASRDPEFVLEQLILQIANKGN